MPQWTSGSWRPGGASGAAAVTLLLSGIMPLFLFPFASAGAYQVPIINVTFEYDRYTAEFNDNGPAILYSNGTVSVKKDPSGKGVATLEAIIDTGWRLLVSPSVLVASENPAFFTVTVVVPPGTPRNLSATLQVFCKFPRAMPASDTAVITVGPSCGVRVVFEKPVQFAGPGQAPRFTAIVTNTGNGNDSFHCSPTIPRPPSSYRWMFSANLSILLDLAPGESRRVSFDAVLVNREIDRSGGVISNGFTFRSLNARQMNRTVVENVSLTLMFKPDWWDRIDVPMVAVILWAGAICAIVVSVIRGRKNRRSLRVPLVKEVGKNGRA